MVVEVDRDFSIREHVAKMRSIDIGKCRPFDGEETLPPMDVRKFRWWSDEVAVAAAPVAVKQRTPKKKKRSIVELFAISPQITAVGGESISSDEEMEGSGDVRTGEEERVEEVSGGEGLYYADLAAVSKRKEKESKFRLKNCKGEKSKKLKNKGEKKTLKSEICVSKKEKRQKQKTQKPNIRSSLSISQLLQEVKRKKMLKKSLKISYQAKTKKKKRKQFPSILTPESKTKSFSVHSILKKQVQTSPIEKHVTFSGNVDIFDREDFSSSPGELALVQSTECPENQEPESVKDSDLGSVIPRIPTVYNELGIENEKENSQGTCVDLNKMLDTCTEIQEDPTRERPELMVEVSREPSMSCLIDKDQIPHADRSITLPGTNTSSRDLISVSSSTGSNKSTSADTRLNTDCLSNLCFSDEFIGLPLNSQGELAIKPKPNLFPNSNELLKRNVMLPGPSGGVLFPGSVPIPGPLPIRPIGMAGPASDVRMRPLYFKDNIGTEHYYAPILPVRPGSGFMHLPGFERMEIQSFDPLLDHTGTPTNIFEIGKNNAEPTVRLMGKNVSLGRSSTDCIGWNRSAWVDRGNITFNGGELPFSRERRQSLPFSVEPRFNEPQGQVYNHAGIAFPNWHSSQPAPHLNPAFTNYNSFRYQKPDVRQQVLLDSTHCNHSQSRNISFASSPYRGGAPQWIQNPRSKTHKPAFPTYVNPTTTQKQPHIVSGNRPNLSSPYPTTTQKRPHIISGNRPNLSSPYPATTEKQPHIVSGNIPNLSSPYPGTVISFPAYNIGSNSSHSRPCLSIPPLNSTFNPLYLTARPGFASKRSKSEGKVKDNSKFHLPRPSDYIKQNNKRPLESDDVLVRPPLKKPFRSDPGSVTKSTGHGTIIGSEKILGFSMSAGKAVDAQVANSKSSEMGTVSFSGPVSNFVVRSGPVKLSAGARHVLTPGSNLDRVNPRPIHSMMPLIGGASLSQRSTEEIYRF